MGEGAGGKVAKQKATRTEGRFGFEDRASLIEGVVGVGQFVEVVRQDIRTEVVQNDGEGFCVLENLQCEGPLGGIGDENL